MTVRFGNGPWVATRPTRKQLEKFTVAQLMDIVRWKRSIKHPFKTVLIDYVLSLGDLD
jgi:hypothetical protein